MARKTLLNRGIRQLSSDELPLSLFGTRSRTSLIDERQDGMRRRSNECESDAGRDSAVKHTGGLRWERPKRKKQRLRKTQCSVEEKKKKKSQPRGRRGEPNCREALHDSRRCRGGCSTRQGRGDVCTGCRRRVSGGSCQERAVSTRANEGSWDERVIGWANERRFPF